MKLKVIPMLCMLLMAGNAAALCDLKVSALDLRDGGLSLDDDAVIRSNNGDPLGDCPLTVRATNLPNPRSSALREFRGTGYESFSQKIEIKNLALTGVGSLRFMSFNFFANQLRYRLDLSVSPGTQVDSYSLSGEWRAFAINGNLIEQTPAFYNQEILSSNSVSLKWQRSNQYPASITLGLSIDNNATPIYTYSEAGNAPYPWANPFYLSSITVGSLSATSLTPQSSFKLGSGIECVKPYYASNPGVCD